MILFWNLFPCFLIGIVVGCFLKEFICHLMNRLEAGQAHSVSKYQKRTILALNVIAYVWIGATVQDWVSVILAALFTSTLILVSFTDLMIKVIPIECNYFIFTLGIIQLIITWQNWQRYLIGSVCVSFILVILYLITKGRGIGGGDIKLMISCGIFLGASDVLVGFLMGCIIALVVHCLRMLICKAGRTMAFGPYLCAGMWLAMLYGNYITEWYLKKGAM